MSLKKPRARRTGSFPNSTSVLLAVVGAAEVAVEEEVVVVAGVAAGVEVVAAGASLIARHCPLPSVPQFSTISMAFQSAISLWATCKTAAQTPTLSMP